MSGFTITTPDTGVKVTESQVGQGMSTGTVVGGQGSPDSVPPIVAVNWGSIGGDILQQLDLQQEFALKAGVAQLNAHLTDFNNPHQTTKAQVGLGNGDNTSDMAKPVSTAQAIAIAAATVPVPVTILNGGTGATTAAAARTNLGSGTIGDLVFTSTTAAAARTDIGAAAAGANSDITSLTGLTTPLAVTEGGTGQNTPLPGRLLATTVFNASGTHTPNALTKTIIYEVCGGGGAGGGAPATSASQFSAGMSGGSGAYTVGSTTTIAVQTVTVGAGGTPVSGAAGGNGGTSSYGTIATAPGGGGGTIAIVAAAGAFYNGGGIAAVVGTGGNIIQLPGSPSPGFFTGAGSSPYGQTGTPGPWGAAPVLVGYANAGSNAVANSGSGGGGSANITSLGAQIGGIGGSGKVIIREYT